MTDAERALNWVDQSLCPLMGLKKDTDPVLTIRKSLQNAGKVDGLVKALEHLRNHTSVNMEQIRFIDEALSTFRKEK